MSAKAKKKKTKWIVTTVIVVVALVAIVGFISVHRKPAGTEVIAKTGDISTYYSFSGSIDAKNRQTVYADSAQQVKEFKVSVGDTVKSGDVLYVTKTGQEVTATIDGEVSSIDADLNQQVMPGAKIMEIVDYNNLELQVQIDEYDISAIKVNDSATVTIHALSKDVTGTVTDVSKEGVYQNGVTFFTATISLPVDNDVRVGMSAEAKVLKDSAKSVVTLPVSAIQFDSNNNPFIYVLNGRKVNTTDITIGVNDGVTAEITSGLKAGDEAFVPKAGVNIMSLRGNRNNDSNSSSEVSSDETNP